jgi:hypothetical protein
MVHKGKNNNFEFALYGFALMLQIFNAVANRLTNFFLKSIKRNISSALKIIIIDFFFHFHLLVVFFRGFLVCLFLLLKVLY